MIDSGAGIAAEDIPKLFKRFGKLDRTAKMNRQGIGLGLTIVKEIAELANGNIKVVSEGVGKGSCFTLNMIMDAQIDSELPTSWIQTQVRLARHRQEIEPVNKVISLGDDMQHLATFDEPNTEIPSNSIGV